ncbi:hypothetical protein ACFQU2_39700 [Siccirubricoccus deserti]
MPVTEALARLGLRPADDRADAARMLETVGFAYLPLRVLSPGLDRLLGLRALLGLRSPVNTVARLLDPFDARASVDGVFHPYIALHLAAAERLRRPRLLVVKGGGGEAERTPLKPVTAHLFDHALGHREIVLPATSREGSRSTTDDIIAVWRGEAEGVALATVLATLALALLALGSVATASEADARAVEIWRRREAM